jgi:hypothetical protein
VVISGIEIIPSCRRERALLSKPSITRHGETLIDVYIDVLDEAVSSSAIAY